LCAVVAAAITNIRDGGRAAAWVSSLRPWLIVLLLYLFGELLRM
jgi:hypothetical protein